MVKVRSEATKVRVSTEVDLWLVRQRGLARLEGMKSKWPRERARSMTLESEMGRSEIGYGYGTLGEGEIYYWQTNRLIPQRVLTSNGDLEIESTVFRESSVGSRQTPHRPSLMDDSLWTHRSKPFLQFLKFSWDQQSSMPWSREVKSSEHLPANSLFVISFWLCMIAISGTYIELNEFTYASWYVISILVSEICEYSWNDILNLKETVVTMLFSKVIEDSFQERDVLEGGAINLSLNGSSIVLFIAVLDRVMRFWKFISILSFFVAIIWAMLEIKDDLRWVPPGCFLCLLVLETQFIVAVGDDVSGLKGRNAYVENEITNFWLIGNLEGKKLWLIILGYAQQGCGEWSFLLEKLIQLDNISQWCNLAYLEELRSFLMGLWPLWLGFMPPNPNFLFYLVVAPLDGFLTSACFLFFCWFLLGIDLNCKFTHGWAAPAPPILPCVVCQKWLWKKSRASLVSNACSFSFSVMLLLFCSCMFCLPHG